MSLSSAVSGRTSADVRSVPVRGNLSGRAGWRAAGWLAGLLVVLTGCAPPTPRRAWNPSQGYEELLAGPCRRLEELDDLVAEAQLTVRSGDHQQRAKALLQLKLPDLLKLEVRGPFYAHILTAVLIGDTLFVHGPAAGGSWRGSADGDLLEVLTGLNLGGYDLRYALLGLVEPGTVDTLTEVRYPRGDRAVVSLEGPGGRRRRIWVDLFRGLVVREEVRSLEGGRMLLRRFGDYRHVGPLLLPSEVEIVQRNSVIQLEYGKYWLNRGLKREIFRKAAELPGTRYLD